MIAYAFQVGLKLAANFTDVVTFSVIVCLVHVLEGVAGGKESRNHRLVEGQFLFPYLHKNFLELVGEFLNPDEAEKTTAALDCVDAAEQLVDEVGLVALVQFRQSILQILQSLPHLNDEVLKNFVFLVHNYAREWKATRSALAGLCEARPTRRAYG